MLFANVTDSQIKMSHWRYPYPSAGSISVFRFSNIRMGRGVTVHHPLSMKNAGFPQYPAIKDVTMTDHAIVYVIACGVLRPELKHMAKELNIEFKMLFLPGKLHNTPDLLRMSLQNAIDEASIDPLCSRIVIGYGLCGRGTVGIRASNVPLVLPKIHDCIALFLGSDRTYKEQFTLCPGTYYITEGWCEGNGRDDKQPEETVWDGTQSLGCNDLKRKFGEKKGEAVFDYFRSWTSNYQRAVYIDTGVRIKDKNLALAKKMAKTNQWKFECIPGKLSLLRKLLISDQSDSELLFVPPEYQTVYSGPDNCINAVPQAGNGDPKMSFGPRHLLFKGNSIEVDKTLSGRFGLGVDAGGTFTDGVIYDFLNNEIVCKNKSLTTRWDFSKGIDRCLAGLKPDFLKKVGFISVSTTLATNAIVEGEGQTVGLLLMGEDGVVNRDCIVHSPKLPIKGRINIDGREAEPVDVKQVRKIAREMVNNEGVTAFAVSGYGASINPVHEQLVRKTITDETGMVVCCGHDFSNKLNFVVRAQTAIVNARVIPRMIAFFKDLDLVLAKKGIKASVMVVKGDGTLISKKEAMEKPVETIFSGPAASVAGARHLTGLNNATVIDIGGTTTDSAEIIDGEVTVSLEGALVGNLQTHVRALKMKTVGLGGDSHIRFHDGKFSLGPLRVAPLVWADEVTHGGISKVLSSMTVDTVYRQDQSIFVAMDKELNFTPDAEETEIFNRLRENPLSAEQLARCVNIISPRLLPLKRLEQSGLVQRCGLTPTDLLHINNLFCRWPPGPAFHMVEILAKARKTTAAILAQEILQLIYDKVALELLNNSVFDTFTRAELDTSALYKHLVEGILGRRYARYGLQVTFNHSVVGIGAAAAHLLPKAANMVSAQIIIPENADVANALGAVTTHILIRRELSIRPENNGRFVVSGIANNPSFASLGAAEEWAVTYLIALLRENAKMAGTSQESVAFDISDRLASLNDGSALFLERNIGAHLKGYPDLAFQSLYCSG